MSKILLTTAYFPPISYFTEIIKANHVFIEAHENYQKQSYRNRSYIAGPNGKQMLNIPVIRVDGNHTPVQEVLLSNQINWKIQQWNSIKTAYNSSPFLLYYEDEIKEVFLKKHNKLWDFNWELLILMLDLLQIKTPIEKTSVYENLPSDLVDFRNTIHPKISTHTTSKPYFQVFDDRLGFIADLSILDLLFNLGTEATLYLKN